MSKELCIHHHLGLGDHFDCNGMVRHILQKFAIDKLYVFSKSNYFDMVDYMYRDEDRIEVVKIDKDLDEIAQVSDFVQISEIKNFLRIGFEHYPTGEDVKQNKNCWEFFYEQVAVPHEVRSDYFYVERDEEAEQALMKKLNPNSEPFLFLHDDPDRGYTLDRSKIDSNLLVIENDTEENIFHFIKVLEEATEIHCMESSFKSLIDFYAKTAKLYYHDFRNHPLGGRTNKKWNIIKYE